MAQSLFTVFFLVIILLALASAALVGVGPDSHKQSNEQYGTCCTGCICSW